MTRTELDVRPRRWALPSALALALALSSPRAQAGGPVAVEPASAAEALEVGDLTAAQELATAARKADPTAARWAEEAATHERAGDLRRALKAWRGHRAALPAGAEAERAAADATIAALEERSRGAQEDEPASTQREALDQAREERLAALRPKPPPAEPVKPPPAPRERVITKWYFWLTVAAIAASAGAITGIAIQAAREEQKDDLSVGAAGRGGIGPAPGGLQLRF